jgi:hypothetical protein
MKTRILLATTLTLALLCLFVGAAPGLAQGCPDCGQGIRPAGAAPLAPAAGATYITAADNEDNAHTGVADGDMGGASPPCVFETDPYAPIEFNIDVTGALPTSSAILTLYVYDVDEDGSPPPEVDEVYFNGSMVGTLTGANDAWSTSVFSLDTADVLAGDNLVEVQIDTAPGSYGRWCVATAWGQLLIDGGTGEASIASIDHEPCYVIGEEVQIDVVFTIDVNTSGNFRLETNLVDPDGITVESDLHTFAGTAGTPHEYTITWYMAETDTPGTYTINASLFNDDTEILQDVEISTYEWAETCEAPPPPPVVPEASSLILLASGAAGMAGYVGLQLRARRRK